MFRYALYNSFGRISIWLLVRLVAGIGSNRKFFEITILGSNEGDFRLYSKCVEEALGLLKEGKGGDYEIVKRNLKYIIYQPRKGTSLATYMHSCCFIRWSVWCQFSSSIRSSLMAAAIVHEAYHGEYQRMYGLNGYNNPMTEKKCREHEIRVLKQFRDVSEKIYANEFDKRIGVLMELEGGKGVRKGVRVEWR